MDKEWAHLDDYEAHLKSAFPDESDEFYEYGKWAGFTEADAFDNLPLTEWDTISEWLEENNL